MGRFWRDHDRFSARNRVVDVAALASAALAIHAAVNARLLRRPPVAGVVDERVSVLVPARDEARHIHACVSAIRRSVGIPHLEVLVLDDGSRDGTGDLARDAGATVLTGQPLPEGWLGKPWACAQLADAARGEVLVFVDADVIVAPEGLAATVALVTRDRGALVSPYPRQIVGSLGERLVQPLLQWSWLTFLPLRLAERPSLPSMTAANGQLLACTVDAYRKAGGHGRVRDAVVEDVWLARAFKDAGLPVILADGTHVAWCRMYESWGEVRDGYGKSLWAAFGSPAGAAAIMTLLSWLYVLPALAAVFGRGRVRRAGLAGYAAGVAGRAVAARRTGGRPEDALAHPLSVLALAGLTARSVARSRRGALTWKGRAVGG